MSRIKSGIFSVFCSWLFLCAGLSSAMPLAKIKSEFLGGADGQKVEARYGSAVFIKHTGAIYILTSSHVVFHGDAEQGFRHSVMTRTGMTADLNLETVNFGMGVALLKLKDSSDEDTLHRWALPFHKLKQLAHRLADTREKEGSFINRATLAGYRRRDLHLIKEANASLLNPDAVMPVLPLLARMLYVHGYSERGMSGGGLFSADPADSNAEFFGLISHHYFDNKGGYDTRLKTYQGPEDSNDVVTLVVPLTEIVPWMNKFLTGGAGSLDNDLRLDVEAQKRGIGAVELGKIRLEEHSCAAGESLEKQDSAAIGGQGSGIGGSGGQSICAIRLKLAKQGTTAWPFEESRAWHDAVVESLTSVPGAFSANELYLTDMSDGVVTEPITDLVSTLAMINSGKYRFNLHASPPPQALRQQPGRPSEDQRPVQAIEIDSITYGGSGCPSGSVNSVVNEESNGFRLTYDRFIAEAGPRVSARSRRMNCQVSVDMIIPHGWSYTLAQVKTTGYAELDEGSSGLHKVSFYFMGQKLTSVVEKKFVGPFADNFESIAEFGLQAVAWSPCGAVRALNIATEARVVSLDKQNAVLATDTLEGTFSQEYHLRWRKCDH